MRKRTHCTDAARRQEGYILLEIVCVLAQSSATPTALPVTIAAAVALILPWLLVAFTAMPVYRILALQLIAFVAVLLLVGIPRVQLLLLPRRTQRQMAYRAAMEQFVIRGIASKNDRCGILIFVSLAERYARIIAEEALLGVTRHAACARRASHRRAGLRAGEQAGCGAAVRGDQRGVREDERDRDDKPTVRALDGGAGE